MKYRLTFTLLLALFTSFLSAQSLCNLTITKVKVDGGYKLTVGSATGDIISGLTWFNGSGDRSVLVTQNGEYCVKALFNSGCSDSECINITDITSADCASEITAVRFPTYVLLCGLSRPVAKSVKWSTGDTTLCIKIDKPGSYVFYAKAANGCESKAIFIYNPDSTDCKVDIVRSATTEFPPSICAVSNVDIKKIKWSTGDTTKCIKVGDAKEYCVTIVGTNGCEAKSCLPVQTECTVTIIKSLNPNNVANLCAISNQDVKSYKWSTNDTTKCITVLRSGQYCVTIVTKSGCERKTCFIYTAPSDLCKADIQRDSINGGIGLCVTSNQEIKTISWSSGETSKCIVPTKNGEYCAKIVTTTGCEAKSCIVYTIPGTECKVEIAKSLDAAGKVTLCAIANQDVSKYKWTTGDTTKCITITRSGEYCVYIITKNGCETKACFTYTFPSDLCKADIKRDSVNGGIGLCVVSNQEIKSVLWNTDETSKCIVPTRNGEYCAKIVTTAGCEAKSCIEYNPQGSDCKVNISSSKIETGYKLCVEGSSPNMTAIQWSNGQNESCIKVTKTGVYCVKVQFADGCSASNCINIVVPPTTNCRVEISKTIIDGVTQFCAKVADSLKIEKAVWSTGESSTCIKPTRSGEYCVVVYTTSGCVAKYCVSYKSPNDTIVGNLPCLLSIVKTKRAGDIYLCALTTGTAQTASLIWSNGSKDKCQLIKSAGTYCVTIKTNVCEAKACYTIDSSELRIFNNSEINILDKSGQNIAVEINSETKIGRFGPNPVMNLINVEIESVLNQSGIITITDAYGKIHLTRKIELFEGQNILDIETSNLNKGLFHINLLTAAGRKSIKIVKE